MHFHNNCCHSFHERELVNQQSVQDLLRFFFQRKRNNSKSSSHEQIGHISLSKRLLTWLIEESLGFFLMSNLFHFILRLNLKTCFYFNIFHRIIYFTFFIILNFILLINKIKKMEKSQGNFSMIIIFFMGFRSNYCRFLH